MPAPTMLFGRNKIRARLVTISSGIKIPFVFDPSHRRRRVPSLAIDPSPLKDDSMNEDDDTTLNQEEPADTGATVTPEIPARPAFFPRAPGRYLVTPSGPNDDRIVIDTLLNVLVCVQMKDDTRRLHVYTPEPPDDYRDIAAGALSALTGAFPPHVPEDDELLRPFDVLPPYLRVLDMQPPNRQEFILATAGPRLYRPHLDARGQLFNLEPILSCCSGWESQTPYINEVGEIYAWFAMLPPVPRGF
jgi:hypothetical protein